MTIELGSALQLLNLLLIPAMAYVIKLERRILTLETIIKLTLEGLPCKVRGGCNHQEVMT